MTDPVIQDQTQGGQNPQTPVQNNEPQMDFDLNLPTNEETVAAEEPAISLDFDEIEKTKIDTPVETNVNDIPAVVESTSIAEETPGVEEATPVAEEVAPVIEETTVTENNVTSSALAGVASDSEAIQLDAETNEKPIEENTTEETTVVEETPVENTVDEIMTELPVIQEEPKQPETKEDNRLDQEDALVEENKQTTRETTPVIENKEEPEVKEESLNMFDETTEKTEEVVEEKDKEKPTINEAQSTKEQAIEMNNDTTENIQTINEEEKPTQGQPEQNFPPRTDLQQDHEIIQQLQESASKQPDTVITTPTEPTATEVNLDDLLSTPTPTTETTTINTNQPIIQQIPVQQTVPQQIPAFTGIQGYSLPPIANQISQQIKKPLNKKILINFGIGVLVFLIGGFMFKTMYPIEYQKIVGNTPETNIENKLTEPTEILEETTTTETDGLFENPALANYHESAAEDTGANSDFNAFEDIEENLIENDDKTIEKIQNYIDVGKKYTVIGKKNNDPEITKSSLFLYKKASALLSDIENGNQISTDELNTQLADLETYLQKLTGKNSDGEIVPQQPSTPTPQEFFGSENSGTEQTESTTTEIPTSGSENIIQEETPIENLSGDENPIIQTNELDG